MTKTLLWRSAVNFLTAAWLCCVLHADGPGQGPPESARRKAFDDLPAGRFRWVATGPLISPIPRADDPCNAIKDPSVVRSRNRWHVFSTIRSRKRTHQIE